MTTHISPPGMDTTYTPIFDIGEVVGLKINGLKVGDQAPGMVTGYLIRPGWIGYLVTWGAGNETTHYDIELEAIDG